MMALKIRTNKQRRDLVPFCDLPEVTKADFDYITPEQEYENRFVKYRGCYYDVYDTVTTGYLPIESPFRAWDSILSESHFDGVLFKLAPNEQVICGTFTT